MLHIFRSIQLGLSTLFLAFALAACGADSGSNSSGGISGKGGHGIDLENKVLRIGALNDESGPAAGIGRPYAVGKRILARQVNAGGSGLLPEGWTIELIERDHGYNPQRSLQLLNEIKDDVLFIGTSFGTPNTLPLRPVLQREGIVAFPASLSSKMAEFEYTPPIGTAYTLEAGRALDWAIANSGSPERVKAGIIYQQDDYGKDGFDGLLAAAKRNGVDIVAEETHAPGQSDFTASVSALKRAGATHVLLITLPSATGPILGTAAQLDYKPFWIGVSPAWIDRFFDPNVIPPSVFENFYWATSFRYWGEDVPFMRDFLATYKQFGKDLAEPDFYIMMSYLQGLLELEIFRQALERGDVSRAGYLKALHGLSKYTANGALPTPADLSKVPYSTGVTARILKPNFVARSWSVVGGYAKPIGQKIP